MFCTSQMFGHFLKPFNNTAQITNVLTCVQNLNRDNSLQTQCLILKVTFLLPDISQLGIYTSVNSILYHSGSSALQIALRFNFNRTTPEDTGSNCSSFSSLQLFFVASRGKCLLGNSLNAAQQKGNHHITSHPDSRFPVTSSGSLVPEKFYLQLHIFSLRS